MKIAHVLELFKLATVTMIKGGGGGGACVLNPTLTVPYLILLLSPTQQEEFCALYSFVPVLTLLRAYHRFRRVVIIEDEAQKRFFLSRAHIDTRLTRRRVPS